MNNESRFPPLRIKGTDVRAKSYQTIAVVHKQIVEYLKSSQMSGCPVALDARVVVHCEEAIAFLAQEVLELRAMVERPEGQ